MHELVSAEQYYIRILGTQADIPRITTERFDSRSQPGLNNRSGVEAPNSMRSKMTPINTLGFISHDLAIVQVVEAKELYIPKMRGLSTK